LVPAWHDNSKGCFADNGIDGLDNPDEPLSADELDRIPAADIGGAVEHIGFPATTPSTARATRWGQPGSDR
jgi:hypothetical protein